MSAEAVFARWASRVEAGDPVDFESVVREHPELETDLRALHDDWKLFAPILGKVVPGLVASGDGVVLPSLTRGPDTDEEPPSEELLAKLGIHVPDEGRYRFRAKLGQGGGGVVLKVWDTKLNRPLAMKVVLGRAEDKPTGQTPRVDGRTLARFVDEARIASQLNHPGIVPVHELGSDETGRAFFTMKLVKGEDLSRVFEKVKTGEDGWNLPRAVGLLVRVCETVAYAHDRGVIHRDLKPTNIRVGPYGEVYVMDWGLARAIGDPPEPTRPTQPEAPISAVGSVRATEREQSPGSPILTDPDMWVGTPCYMSPEQARGELDAVGPLSDVYAIGAMLYQLLTGTPPYIPPGERGDPFIILRETRHGPPLPVESLAPRAIPELVAICDRAMARAAFDRYESMRAAIADLQAFLDGRVVRAHRTGAWIETRKWVQRNRSIAATVFGALAISTAAAIALRQSDARLRLALSDAEAKKREAIAFASERDAAASNATRLQRESESLAAKARWSHYVAAIRESESARLVGEPAAARRALDSAPAEHRGWEWAWENALLSQYKQQAVEPSARLAMRASVTESADVQVSGGLLFKRRGAGAQYTGLPESAGFTVVAFDDGGNRVIASRDDGLVVLWQPRAGQRLASFETTVWGAMPYQQSGAPPVALSRDGRLAAYRDGPTTCVVLDTDTLRAIRLQSATSEYVQTLWFSTDSRRCFTHSSDHVVREWNVSSGALLASDIQSIGMPDTVECIFRHGAVALAAPGDSTTIYDNDLTYQIASLSVPLPYFKFPESFALSDDLQLAAYWNDAQSAVEVWNLLTCDGRSVPLRFTSVFGGGQSPGVEWIPGTHILAAFDAGTGAVHIFSADDVAFAFDLIGHTSHAGLVGFSVVDHTLVTESVGEMLSWDLSFAFQVDHDGADVGASWTENIPGNRSDLSLFGSGPPLQFTMVMGSAEIADTCPFGSRILVNSRTRPTVMIALPDKDKVAILDDGATGACIAAKFSPNGRWLVTASQGASPALWSASLAAPVHALDGHRGIVMDVSFSPTSTLLASVDSEGGAMIWGVERGDLRASVRTDGMLSIARFVDDDCVALCSRASILVWRLVGDSWRMEREIETPHVIACLEVVPGSDLVLVGWNGRTGSAGVDAEHPEAAAYRIGDGSLVSELGDRGNITTGRISVSATASRFVTVTEANVARLWDLSDFHLISELGEWNLAPWTFAFAGSFSPDGSRVVTASAVDKTIRVWAARDGELLARLRGCHDYASSACFDWSGQYVVSMERGGDLSVWSGSSTAAQLHDNPERRRAISEAMQRLESALLTRDTWEAAAAYALGAEASGDDVDEPIRRKITSRSNAAYLAARQTIALRARRTWAARMLAGPSVVDLETILRLLSPTTSAASDDIAAWAARAWQIVDPDGPEFGPELEALDLAARAVSAATSRGYDWETIAEYRATLAWALFRVGALDRALAEYRSLAQNPELKERGKLEAGLRRLEDAVGEWRDEAGVARTERWIASIADWDAEITRIESDPGVRLWLREGIVSAHRTSK